MIKLIPVIVFLYLFPKALEAQMGCTDPQAINYDPQAIINDGSCTYATTNYSPTTVAVLAANLIECSGLAYFDDKLWTHLDGGNVDQIYEVDTLNGTIETTVPIINADNKDWEDLAEDEEHLYIGDFGNNFGNRTDLRIYKIKKSDIVAGTPSPELINFSFSDQTDFSSNQNAHNYDCEAFFYYQDSLHLFSKNWLDFKTRHYVLPTTPGSHIAALRDSLESQGQITAADISEEGVALLLGYNVSTLETFMWLLFDFPSNQVFKGNKRKIIIGSALQNGQVEGIVFKENTSGYICSEQLSSFINPKLLSFDIDQFLSDPVSTKWTFSPTFKMDIYPNPTTDFLNIELEGDLPGDSEIIVLDGLGRSVFEQSFSGNIFHADLSNIGSGVYYLVLKSGDNIVRKSFAKK